MPTITTMATKELLNKIYIRYCPNSYELKNSVEFCDGDPKPKEV